MKNRNKSLFKVIICVSVLFLFYISCNESSDFKGYSSTNSGLHYKIISLGEGLIKPASGDYLQLAITYKTIKDSVFLDTYSYNETGMVILPIDKSSFKGSFEEVINKMNEGDAYSFIVSADSLFKKFFKRPLPLFLKQGGDVKMTVFLYKILSKNEYLKMLNNYQLVVDKKEVNEKKSWSFF